MFLLRTLLEILIIAVGAAAGYHLVNATTGAAGAVNNELANLEG
jgi:hypothetical protein